MRTFFIANNWYAIGVWNCKYDPSTTLCQCCQPKHVMPPQVLKHPNREFREYFRQIDSSGKSRTPKGSIRHHRRVEASHK